MKIDRIVFLAACAAACSGAAMADSREDSTHDPASIAFVPAAHEFYGATTFGYAKSTGDVSGGTVPGGTPGNYSFETRSELFFQSFSYGFTERFSLTVGLGHTHVDTEYQFASGTTKSTDSGGNARIFVTGRVLSQATDGLNLDLSLGARGAGAAVSYQGSALTVLGRAGVYYVRGLTTFDSTENADISHHDAWGYLLGLETQLRLSQQFSVGLDAGYVSSPFSASAATVNGSSFRLRQPDNLALGASAVWRLTPERLSLTLGFEHDFIGRRVDEYPNPAMNIIQSGHGQNDVRLTIAYRL